MGGKQKAGGRKSRFLCLNNQDTSRLSLDELYALYRETLKEVEECEERDLDAHKENVISFD